MRLAVHGRKCRNITERTDRPAAHLGAVSLTAILQHFNAALVRFHDNLVDISRLSRCVYHYHRRHIGRDTFEKLRNAHVIAVLLAICHSWLESIENDRA